MIPRVVALSAGLLIAFGMHAAFARSSSEIANEFQAALSRGDLAASAALFADDAVVLNSRGRRYEGHDAVTAFLRGTIAAGVSIAPIATHDVAGGAAWSNVERSDAYDRLGVAVHLRHKAAVRDDRIVVFVTWFEAESLDALQAACMKPENSSVTIFNQPCERFIAQARAFSEAAERQYGEGAK